MTKPLPYPRQAFLVSHTHWDREWYLSFPTFRTKLTRVVREVLDLLESDPDFEHFLMDGQAIILEDHLELHPEDEPRIRAQVEAGRLSIGPWYMLPDEFLISAESSVRNLLVGTQICSRFGGAQTAGYMADSFGHVAQVPQLLSQSGFDSFVYQRGNGDELDDLGLEYDWEAPDGSRVLAIQQWQGYCNAAGLGFEEIWHAHTQREVDLDRAEEKIRELFARMGERSNGTVALLNNGCDHFPPQQDFGKALARLRAAFPDTEFRHTGLESVVDAVRKNVPERKVFRGELLGGKFSHILSGVWSARMYLKQWNDRCQTLLSGQLEPLAAYGHFVHGNEYPAGLLRHSWKRLLQNHPHDSICGCSIDEVHEDMMPRFREVVESGEEAAAGLIDSWCPTFARHAEDDDETVLCVTNPLPQTRSSVVDRLVVLQPCCADTNALRLYDEEGHEVPFRIVKSWFVERFWGIDYRKMLHASEQLERFAIYRRDFGERMLKTRVETDLTDRYLWIQFRAEQLPACGHRLHRLTTEERMGATEVSAGSASDAPAVAAVHARPHEWILENEFVKVRVHANATIDLRCKQTDRVFSGLHLLEDREDIGDEYDYSPAEQTDTRTVRSLSGERSLLFANDLAAAIEVQLKWKLPTEIQPDRRSRRDEEAECAVRLVVRIDAGNPMIDFELQFDNQVRDHRLRARFPFGLETQTVWSDGHFYTNPRPLRPTAGEDWVQPSPGPYPQQDFTLLQDDLGGVALLNRGLPEVETRTETTDERTNVGLDLTLLRSVGWLSRDDFPARRNQNAGPTIPTPNAQCPGMQRFRYALLPFKGDWRDAEVKRASTAWHTPPLVMQGVLDGARPGDGSFLECQSSGVSVTAIKKHETRETLIVRLYSLLDEPTDARLVTRHVLDRVWICDPLENRREEIETSGRAVELSVAPHRIVTVELSLMR